jgi:hypothetical protein
MSFLLHRIRTALQTCLLVVPLAMPMAAAADDDLPSPKELTGAAAAEAVKAVKSPQQFDLSRISVLRLVVEGKQMEVTSLGPAILSGKPNESFTAGMFSQDRQSVTFTSSGNGRVTQLVMPAGALQPQAEFRLLLVAPGEPDRDVRATVSSLLTRP